MNQIVERKWTISLQRPAAVELCCWPTSSCHYPLVTYYSSSVYSFKLSTVKHTTHDKCAIWLDSDSDCTTSLITNTRIHRTVWCWFICHQMFPSTTVASMAVILRLSVICFRWFEMNRPSGWAYKKGSNAQALSGKLNVYRNWGKVITALAVHQTNPIAVGPLCAWRIRYISSINGWVCM